MKRDSIKPQKLIMKSSNFLTPFLVIVIGLSVLLVLFPWSILDGVKLGSFIIELKSYSEFGTFVGGITSPILSLSAFILLFLTFRKQQKNHENSRIDFNTQIALNVSQNQESTYFSLLNNHIQAINNIKVKRNGPSIQKGSAEIETIIYEGKDAIPILVTIIESKYKRGVKNIIGYSKADSVEKQGVGFNKEEKLGVAFREVYLELNAKLNVYFKSLEVVLNYIKSTSHSNKKIWLDTLKSHISIWEQLIIIYYCHSEFISVETLSMIKQFDLINPKLVNHEILDRCFIEIVNK